MKTLLVGINSQYVHTNLAVFCLESACIDSRLDVKTLEFSINDHLSRIFGVILRERPNVVAFSCYIWNIEMVKKLIGDIKQADGDIIVIVGGPEVSFDGGGLLSDNTAVDFLIAGEGEEKLPFLIHLLEEGKRLSERENKWLTEYSVIDHLNQLSLPYETIQKGVYKHKLAYLETSRGCPFHCSYCISSVSGGIRYFDLESVYKAIGKLVESGTRVIKFIDRTFNAHEKRALAIWNHILKFAHQGIVFHYEIDPGILTEKMLHSLTSMPPGLVQIEAGIQSVHQKTLEAVERPYRVEHAFENLKSILDSGNVHVHVDLIAGLPHEDLYRFRQSFNRVYSLFAHHFQLGFLKILRGSALCQKAETYGYKYRSYPPYEFISNQYLSSDEVLILKDIEVCLALFYNSGRISATLKWIYNSLFLEGNKAWAEPFFFYKKLACWMRQNGYLDRPLKASALYEIMYSFTKGYFPELTQEVLMCLRFDYFRSMKKPSIPFFMQSKENEAKKKRRYHKVIEYREELEQILPRLQKTSLEKILQDVYITTFQLPQGMGLPGDAEIAFDFGDVDPVTSHAGFYLLKSL